MDGELGLYVKPVENKIFSKYRKKPYIRLSERPEGSIPALGDIFQAAGPFGVKVAQALRSSGILPPEQRKELDSFFDNVFVNHENEAIKANRKNTIGKVYQAFRKIADIKEITI